MYEYTVQIAPSKEFLLALTESGDSVRQRGAYLNCVESRSTLRKTRAKVCSPGERLSICANVFVFSGEERSLRTTKTCAPRHRWGSAKRMTMPIPRSRKDRVWLRIPYGPMPNSERSMEAATTQRCKEKRSMMIEARPARDHRRVSPVYVPQCPCMRRLLGFRESRPGNSVLGRTSYRYEDLRECVREDQYLALSP